MHPELRHRIQRLWAGVVVEVCFPTGYGRVLDCRLRRCLDSVVGEVA